jgi:hypothetical protein
MGRAVSSRRPGESEPVLRSCRATSSELDAGSSLDENAGGFSLTRMRALPVLFLAAACVAGCAKSSPPEPVAPARHEHHAPHGGTPVVLGHEAYHLELVRDAAAGKLSAYVLDGEMESFIRVPAPEFEVVAMMDGQPRRLEFKAAANPATGETVGDTSQFDAQADWLKTTTSFDATLTKLEIKGTVFAGVAFNFPKGNDKD